MKRIATFIIALMLLTSPAWALKSLGGAGGGGGGGGTLITSGSGDFGVGTAQTGGVLNGTVVNLSNANGSASLADSGLATPHPPGGAVGSFQYQVDANTFGGTPTVSGDFTLIPSTGVGTVTNLSHVTNASLPDSGLATPHAPSGSGLLQYNNAGSFAGVPTVNGDFTLVPSTGLGTVQGILTKSIPSLPVSASALVYDGSAFAWDVFFTNPLNTVDSFLQGGATTTTPPTVGALPACLDSGGNHLNYSTSTHALSCGTSSSATGTVSSGTGPAIAQYNTGTGTTLVASTVSQDCTIAQGGAITCTKSAGNAFNGSTFGGSLTGMNASNISSGTLGVARMPTDNAFSATNSVAGIAGSDQQVIFSDGGPSWMHNFYNATDTITDATQNLQGVYHVASLTLSVGHTITVTNTLGSTSNTPFPRGALIVFSQGACTIHGIITAAGIYATGTGTSQGDGGGAGGGGGGATLNPGVAGVGSNWLGGASTLAIAGGGAAGTTGGANPGGNAGVLNVQTEEMVSDSANTTGSPGGSAGGAGGVGNTGTAGTAGAGGGAIMLICSSIVVDGSLLVNGTNGGNGGNSTTSGGGGGGGGGGGFIILASRTLNTAGSTINFAAGSGGSGGTGATAGGTGGNGSTGWQQNFTLN